MIMKECFIHMLTWLHTVLHTWHTYVSRLWVSGGADKMDLEEIPDSLKGAICKSWL